MTSSIRKVLVAAVALVLLAACGHPTQDRTMTIALVDGRPAILPTVVSVDKENRVVMTVSNTTNAVHGFTIEGYSRSLVLEGGQTEELRFNAYRGGTFRIFCQLHPAHQTATLVVR